MSSSSSPARSPAADQSAHRGDLVHGEATRVASPLSRCEALERGRIVLLPDAALALPAEDREFLLSQEWNELRLHKNVSYRPSQDALGGFSGDPATAERLRAILRGYSQRVVALLQDFLAPYAGKWSLDYTSFRPFEEEGRDLSVHKRNDLLHVDAFPSRPTRGGRILRVFTNLNSAQPRVWHTTVGFEALARQYAKDAGLDRVAASGGISRPFRALARTIGIGRGSATAYDQFMLRFHDYLKENSDFQANCPKVRAEFAPLSSWMVFTCGVAHAVMSGRYAIEQTLIIPPEALVAPQHAPYKILETMAGRPLLS